ncbi:MAG: B12-binding domain-containing radical SAM protein [Eubacteriales bacterium]
MTAYLKNKGIDVVQKDFNVEAYNILLSESYLSSLKERLQYQFKSIDSKGMLMPGAEQKQYYDIFNAKSSITYIAERIENAKSVLRNKKSFYDINALSNARSILKQAQIIISTSCLPNGRDLMLPVNIRFQRTFEDIDKITINKIENPFLNLYEDNLLSFIIEQDPDVIGISVTFDGQFIPALTLSRFIKSSYKKAHVVVGGHVITVLTDVLLKHKALFESYFDSAIINEGEHPLLRLIENISDGKSLKEVPNLIYLDQGKICVNPVEHSEDINALPTPCFDDLPFDLYLNPELVLPLLSSRGCYWGKCAFCSDSEFYRCNYQCRDANMVADDIQELSRKYGVTHFSFSDEAISPSSMNRISDELIKRNINIRCSSNVRLERQFTPELSNKMYKAGFKLLYFGLESACNRVLDLMEKGITKETAIEVCRNVYNAGIWNHLYVIFGFPTESYSEVQETIDFLISNEHIIRSFKINSFALDKNAPIMKSPEHFGIIRIDKSLNTDFDLTFRYIVESGLTSENAIDLSAATRDKLAKIYRSKKFFKLDGDDMPLYLSHFEKSDPYLKSIPIENVKNIPINKSLSIKSVPKIKRNVVLNKGHFNIIDVIHNIANDNNTIAYPDGTETLFDPVSEKLSPLDYELLQIISFCDGNRNIQQIANEICNKNGGFLPEIENECLNAYSFLSRQGYITT